MPSTSLKDVIFWSTIAFAFGGVESASTMGEEIAIARRTVPRAIDRGRGRSSRCSISPARSASCWRIPKEQVSGLQGIMQAIQAMAGKVGVAWLAPIVAALVTLNALGGVGGWFAATARLPFVAGIDRFLPRAFGELHPRWQTPHVALLVQAAIAAVFVVLGQAGTSVRGAYDVLVSMSIICVLHPVPLHVRGDDQAAARAGRPGRDARAGRRGRGDASSASWASSTTAVAIVLACVPADDEPNKTLAVVKIVGCRRAARIGAVVYVGRSRAVIMITSMRR